MMELNDILALVKAGYTRGEIAQMEQPGTANVNPEPVPAPVPEPEPKLEPTNVQAPAAEPVAVPVAQPVPQPQPTEPTMAEIQPTEPTMAEIMQSIAKLTSAVQANAIAQSVIPGAMTQPTPTAEDMLAEIIRPAFKARE